MQKIKSRSVVIELFVAAAGFMRLRGEMVYGHFVSLGRFWREFLNEEGSRPIGGGDVPAVFCHVLKES